MMANSSAEVVACPAPFLNEVDFPITGGFTAGRFCSPLLGPSCCLPCPQTPWLYPDSFDTLIKSTNWVNVASLACCGFLLISYAALPANKTNRHYLSICLIFAIVFMQLGFVIPLAAKPEQCFNAITPNGMKGSATCALSGAFLLGGGWAAVMWILLRVIALHLQICWQVVLGKTFMWGAFAAGWGIPAVALTISLIFSGVSFRFGDTCHINHKDSLADFWIPLLIFAAITIITQFATFGYCVKVYVASLNDDSQTTNSSGLPSYTTSVRGTITPRQAYRRIRRVLELQWRGIVVVLIIVADVVFFAVIFVFLDDIETNLLKNPLSAKDWLSCLVLNAGNKNKCLSLASKLVVNEATVGAVLILLSVNGLWAMVFFAKVSMFVGWYELVRGKVKPNTEFVSADVGRLKDPGSYEMLGRDFATDPEPVSFPVTITPLPPTAPKSGRETPDYFGKEARYKSPSRSFSAPKTPMTQSPPPLSDAWDSRKTHANPYYAGMDPLSMNKI